VVAEGIEEEDQRNVLTSLGVDELQGYLLSRPIPSDEFKLEP
jgi:EAL domain-containing protein (putative c-di-GMP-specific phosphodiesterase class I)